MKKIYYLSTCDTCKRILSSINTDAQLELQDLKTRPITLAELEQIRNTTESYEALINKRARLYKERELKNQNLTEEVCKELLLEHYTFLKRPIIINEDAIFIGNAKKTVAAAIASFY